MPIMSQRTRTIAYLRVSTDKQADAGVSLDAQRAKVLSYASLYELDLVDIIVDAAQSAKTLDRPGLQDSLSALRSGRADAILVVKLDRLTRSVRDLGLLVEQYFSSGKWALMSVSEQIDTRSAAGRLVLNVLASVAQWEREATGERTSAALQHKRHKGEYTGGRAPYGHRLRIDGMTLDEDPAEKAALAAAHKARNAGLSLRAIAAEIDRRGFVSRTGQAFGPAQIRRMVAR
jgi:DNA invertase Pin-like site-specific DNA recombinase